MRRRRDVPAHLPRRDGRAVAWPSSCCWTGCSRARCSHALATAEECLRELDPDVGRAGVGAPSRRIIGRARTGLEYVDAADLLATCPASWSAVQTRVPRGLAARSRPATSQTARRSTWVARGGLSDVGWRLRIRHHTGFQYAGQVVASYNEARMTPLTTSPAEHRSTPGSRCKPGATLTRYWDYWGTQVTAFDLHEPHDAPRGDRPQRRGDLGRPAGRQRRRGWDELDSPPVRDRFVELLPPTARTDGRRVAAGPGGRPARPAARRTRRRWRSADLVARGRRVRPGRDRGADRRAGRVRPAHGRLPGPRAPHRRRCCARWALPARYVSGYLHPRRRRRRTPVTEGQSHAWVEWWAGRVDARGTRRTRSPSARATWSSARGRDYDDVPPLKGVYRGAPSTVLTVRVEVERLA